MNKDFEVNKNDTASEVVNTAADITEDNTVIKSAENAVEETVVTEEAPAVEETATIEETVVTEEAPASEEPVIAEEAPAAEAAVNIEQAASVKEEGNTDSVAEAAPTVEATPAYTPIPTPTYTERSGHNTGDYAYTRPEDSSSGYVWDGTANAQKTAKKKKSSGTSGFKVFTAAMLCVFTLSALTIAGFLAADYMRDSNASSSKSDSEKNSYTVTAPVNTPPVASQNSTTMISTFTQNESGLTKTQVAAKCQPSTVGIVVEQEQTYSGYNMIPYGFEDFFGGYGGFNMPGGTQIIQGSGSGFIFSADGYIITNHHVVDGADSITVYLSDGTTAEATLVGSDALSDIAVIKIDATDKTLIPMEIGDSGLMKVGDEVIAIGCPAGIEFMGTVTDGIISAINRDVELDNSGSYSSSTKTMTLLQTNATINKGNSGGPLINSKGQVIGINTLKLSADYEGIGFSIPINGALPIIEQLINHGKVIERNDSFVSSEGIIGISASEITESEAEYYDIPRGLLVVQINKDSSAARAGLRRGDIITKFNGKEVYTVNELNELKYEFKAGEEVTVTVYRDDGEADETLDITFKLDMAS